MDLAAREKICYGDWVDDRTTEASASPRSDLSLCDEAAENEPAEAQYELAQSEPAKRHISWGDFSDSDDSAPKDEKQASGWADFVDSARVDEARKESGLSWADLEDTGSEDEPAQEKVDFKQERRWSDLVDSASDDEFASRNVEEQAEEADQLPSLATDASMELADSSEVNPARSTRSSRRSRAAHARAAAADDCCSTAGARDSIAWTDTPAVAKADGKGGSPAKGSGKGKGADKGAGKGASKGASKGADKGSGKGANKGAAKGAAKGTGKGSSKGSSKGAGKGGGEKGGSNVAKYQCQMIIGIEEDTKFRVVRRMIGSGGENMKNINQQSQAKLRLRGRGSKFLEGDYNEESTDDLMLCVSSQDKSGYDMAKAMASELLQGIHQSYRAFCHKAGKDCPDLKLEIHEGYRSGSR